MNDLSSAMQRVDADRTEAVGGAGVSFVQTQRPKAAPAVGEKAVRFAVRDSAVENPPHYGGAGNPYETINVIEAWGLNFNLGNTVKYISRSGKKDQMRTVEDLQKARWYLDREIANLEAANGKD